MFPAQYNKVPAYRRAAQKKAEEKEEKKETIQTTKKQNKQATRRPDKKGHNMNITGSLQNNKGYWFAVLRIPDETGKKKQKTVSLHMKVGEVKKADAQRACDDIIYKARHEMLSFEKNSFVQYVERWLEHKKLSVGEGTYQSYCGSFKKHIAPFYAERKTVLQNMKLQDVQDFIDHLIRDAKLKPQTVRKILCVVNGALDWAEKDELIRKNPAKHAEIPSNEESDVARALTPAEVRTLLEASEGKLIHTAIVLAAYLGLRREEVAGLRWENVNLEAKSLLICETTTQIYGEAIHAKRTKSRASRRELPLSDEVCIFLQKLYKQQALDKLKHGAHYTDNDFVYRKPNGGIPSPQSITGAFARLVRKAGIAPCRFHDLRHTAATVSLDNGASMKDVQTFLGHSQMSTTADIYAHVSAESRRATAERLSAAFAG